MNLKELNHKAFGNGSGAANEDVYASNALCSDGD